MNLNDLLHREQICLVRQQTATHPAEIRRLDALLADLACRLSALHYPHRPYAPS